MDRKRDEIKFTGTLLSQINKFIESKGWKLEDTIVDFEHADNEGYTKSFTIYPSSDLDLDYECFTFMSKSFGMFVAKECLEDPFYNGDIWNEKELVLDSDFDEFRDKFEKWITKEYPTDQDLLNTLPIHDDSLEYIGDLVGYTL